MLEYVSVFLSATQGGLWIFRNVTTRQTKQPNNFPIGAVLAQLMSVLYSQANAGAMTHPAVVFGGNGIRNVLYVEGSLGAFFWIDKVVNVRVEGPAH